MGDIALARIPEVVVIERKTPSDLAGCIGASRERFERELRRRRYVGRFLTVVEGTLADVHAPPVASIRTQSTAHSLLGP
jgi:hypothetical protein